MDLKKLTPPPRHDFLMTEDGSVTIVSHQYQEAAHSIHGAISETKLRFLQACQLQQRLENTSSHHIFEVGFGLGLGFMETFELSKKYPQCKVHFITCEIDEALVFWLQKNLQELFAERYSLEAFELLAQLKMQNDTKVLMAENSHFKLTLYLGNICDHEHALLSHYAGKIDSIFQDAYSPKKNPELWTVEWFQLMHQLSHSSTILSTYSSSQSVQKNLQTAGFYVTKGPAFGQKKSSTIAFAQATGNQR